MRFRTIICRLYIVLGSQKSEVAEIIQGSGNGRFGYKTLTANNV